MTRLVCILLLCWSSFGFSEGIQSIHIFSNDEYPVEKNIEIPKNIKFEYYNLDNNKHAMLNLNEQVTKLANQQSSNLDMESRFRAAFFEFKGSSKWGGFHDQLKNGSLGIGRSAQLYVEKIPAILINEKYVIYGMQSLRSALKLFDKRSYQL